MTAQETTVGSTHEGRAGGPLLDVRGLTVEFAARQGALAVVQDVDLAIESGEVHAIVGESGSGKSVTALAIMGLLPRRTARIARGTIRVRDRDLTAMSPQKLRAIQGREMAMVFQEPMTSLNPAFTVGDQIAESVRFHLDRSRRDSKVHAIELLDEVGIPQAARRYASYPHEFSGGMRQRVMIAIALACEPALLIADEPTTALDVTIQAQIVDLLRRLTRDHKNAVMFITHDFGVVAEVADNVTVMYAAQVIEQADVYGLFATPRHPYTEALLHAVPSLDDEDDVADQHPLRGAPPAPGDSSRSCHFAPRCGYAIDACRAQVVSLAPVEVPTRLVRCIRAHDLHLTGRA